MIWHDVDWTAPSLLDKPCPHAAASSNASGLMPPRWLWWRSRIYRCRSKLRRNVTGLHAAGRGWRVPLAIRRPVALRSRCGQGARWGWPVGLL